MMFCSIGNGKKGEEVAEDSGRGDDDGPRAGKRSERRREDDREADVRRRVVARAGEPELEHVLRSVAGGQPVPNLINILRL